MTSGDIKIGDTVKMTTKSGEQFEEKISSMQIEHADIDIAKKGDEFGLKVSQAPKDHSDVVKV